MDFSFRALRFIVAVWSFFGFKARVFAFLMNDAPARIPRPLEIEAGLHHCGVQIVPLG
jgi:hypothetical protein